MSGEYEEISPTIPLHAMQLGAKLQSFYEGLEETWREVSGSCHEEGGEDNKIAAERLLAQINKFQKLFVDIIVEREY